MPLTKIQSDVLQLLAAHRDPESYVGGATPLNRKAPRFSDDIVEDAAALEAAGYQVQWLRQLPMIYTASVSGDGDDVSSAARED